MGHILFILGTLAIALLFGTLASDPSAARGFLYMWGLGMIVVYFFAGCWYLIYTGAVQMAAGFKEDVAAERQRRRGYHG